MSSSHDELADIIIACIYKILKKTDSPVAKTQMGYFVATEAVDANLSQVSLIDGSLVRFIPKSDNIGAMSVGDELLLLRGDKVPLTIICRVIGDITLAA